jgi:hypothetical protein
MGIIITAPKTGSLQIQNTSASPQSNYLCNLATDNVVGDGFVQTVNIYNSNQQLIQSFPVSKITNIGGVPFSGTLQTAVDDIALLLTGGSIPGSGFTYTFDFKLA